MPEEQQMEEEEDKDEDMDEEYTPEMARELMKRGLILSKYTLPAKQPFLHMLLRQSSLAEPPSEHLLMPMSQFDFMACLNCKLFPLNSHICLLARVYKNGMLLHFANTQQCSGASPCP